MHTDFFFSLLLAWTLWRNCSLQVLVTSACCTLPPETASVFITTVKMQSEKRWPTLGFVCLKHDQKSRKHFDVVSQQRLHLLHWTGLITFTPTVFNSVILDDEKQHSGVVEIGYCCVILFWSLTYGLDWEMLRQRDSATFARARYKETRTVTLFLSYHDTP